ncbi:hypothetical protein ACQ4PT_055064 [Festuca glaucescens]
MKQPLSDSSCPASASHGNHRLGSYEPTSVLDPIATSRGSPATTVAAPAHGGTQQHAQATPHHPPDDWDALSWLLSPDQKDGAGELFSLNAQHFSPFDVLADPFDPYCSPPAESHEQHLRAAAEAVWSGDSVAANGMLAQLTQALPRPPRTPLQRAASHFAEALQSLLAAPDQFLAQPERPAVSAADVIRRIGAQRAFACLSPVPQFASFTANQTLLEAFEAAAAPFHIIDFDLGLGGQWSSFVEEVAARRLPSQHATATPAVRVTAVVHEETAETLLAADNLRDFACGHGVRFAIVVVRLDALAGGTIRASGDEAVAIVLSPAIFRHLAATRPDASDALLEFIRRTDPRVVVLVDAEVSLGAGEGVAPLMRSVESCAVLTESVEAAAAVGAGEDAVLRVDRGVVRERAYAAVRSWWSRCEPWKDTVVRARWAPAALSDLATAQAEWIVRRAPVEGYHVVRRDGALVLCWHGYDLAATSAWRC